MTTIKTRAEDIYGRLEEHVFSGKIVSSSPDDPLGTIRMTTELAWFPERIIPKDEIVRGVKRVRLPRKGSKTFKVNGSMGDVYTVTKQGKVWSCTCVGYGFRRTCSHIKTAITRDKKKRVRNRIT